MVKPYLYKSIYKSESLKVLDFCIQKFKLKNAFELNDKFEGRSFYEKSLKNYIINKLLFEEVFKIHKTEIGLLIGDNFKSKLKTHGYDLMVTDELFNVNDVNLKTNDFIFLFNLDSLKVSLYSRNLSLIEDLKKITFD